MLHEPAESLASDPLRREIVACAREYRPEDSVAYDAARECLVDALAGALEALRDPACTKLIGPVVPGATMIGGARVPGTSYELDPVKAAFDLGTLIDWHAPAVPDVAAENDRPADCLGGLLATVDWWSRTRLATGDESPTVHDLLATLLTAQELQRMLGQESVPQGFRPCRASRARVATAAAVAAALGGTHAQVLAAVSHAVLDGGAPRLNVAASGGRPRARWTIGDADSRGVRLALIALAEEPPGPATHPPACAPAAHGSPMPSARRADDSSRPGAEAVRTRFAAAVRAHYPARQAALLAAIFADAAALDAKPVHELVSALVRN